MVEVGGAYQRNVIHITHSQWIRHLSYVVADKVDRTFPRTRLDLAKTQYIKCVMERSFDRACSEIGVR